MSGGSVSSLSDLRTSVNAPLGQVDTHSPQPMQRSVFRATWSPSFASACIWHRSSAQTQQPCWHTAASSLAMNALATISEGLGSLWSFARMVQQQPQQQQRISISLALDGRSARLAALALDRISNTSDRSMGRPMPIRAK